MTKGEQASTGCRGRFGVANPCALVTLESAGPIRAVLDHLRVPLIEMDPDAPCDPGLPGVVLLAGAGVVSSAGESLAAWLAAVQEAGGGICVMDPLLDAVSNHLRGILGLESVSEPSPFEAFLRPMGVHFLLAPGEGSEAFQMIRPVQAARLSLSRPEKNMLFSQSGDAVWAGGHGRGGRAVVCGVDPCLWDIRYFGPAAGLDDLIWRSLAWAARKPFAMAAMPPLVAARLDDVIGETGLWHAKTLIERGLHPNLGLDLDYLFPGVEDELKALAQSGKVQLSPHSFTSYRFLPHDQTELIYMEWEKGDYSEEVIASNFQRVDDAFSRFGVLQAKALNYHFCQIGRNAVGFLRERGVKYLTFPFLHGETLQAAPHRYWRPAPYGRLGYVLDWLPDGSFFVICAFPFLEPGAEELASGEYRCTVHTTSDLDFLYGCNLRESLFHDHDKAVKKLTRQLRIGLGSGFFGHVFTHEPLLVKMTPEDWRIILDSTLDWLEKSQYPWTASTLDAIGDYAIRWREAGRALPKEAPGQPEAPEELSCWVFTEKADGTRISISPWVA